MIIFFFLIGLAVGSFLNCLIHRLETGESVIKKRSYCPYCKKILSWFELIPLMSFILQGGKCRKCHKKISWQYPLVELLTGAFFAFIGFNVFWLFIVSCLVVIFVYDLKHYIIPNEVIYPAIIIAFLYRLFDGFNYFLAAILVGAFFLVIVLVSKGKWMGVGDIKLALFMGLILGWPKILVALFLAFLIGALVSVILILFKKKTLKSQIPFGPFLSGATIVAMFWGNFLIDWYLNLFL
jgi:prepilin signal peptidase PulO-like enzyme (type II secretory pathway)